MPVCVAAVVGAVYVLFACWQWTHIVVRSWDLGIFTQLVQSYARLRPPIVDIKGDGFNLLGDHFHPLLALLAPVYALFPSAFTLLVVQGSCFGLSAGILARAATGILRSAWLAAAVGVVFGLSWGLQHAADAQFHEIATAVPLLTVSLCALLARRWRASLLWAAPLVFVKEDLGLTVVAIGLLIAYRSRRPAGIWLAVWGAAWFLIAVLVVLPLFSPTGAWQYAGSADIAAALSDPATLFHPSKGLTLALLLIASAGAVLRSPVAIVLLPTLAWRFLSTNEGYWGPTWHYSAVLMPIAFVALLDAVRAGRVSRRRWMRGYARWAAPGAIVAAMVLLPGLPVWSAFAPDAWPPAPRAVAAHAVLDAVPAGAGVETDVGLMSYLVDAHDVHWIGNANPPPDCILIDRLAGGTPSDWGSAVDVGRRLHPGTAYRPTRAASGYELACR